MGAEGWFHIFDLSSVSTKSDISGHHDCLFSDEQKALYMQHIPANTKVMLISDIGELKETTVVINSSQEGERV